MAVRCSRLALLALGLAVSLSACAPSAPDEPPVVDNGGNDGGGQTGGGNDGGGDGDRFSFKLPRGETGVDAGESVVYPSIQSGDCGGAQKLLDGDPPSQETALWPRFDNPRNVLLFQAGIALCNGDADAARGWYAAAEQLGFAETDRPNICPMYQVTSSVLAQRPPEEFSCEGGEAPDFTVNFDAGTTDDPRTPENEAG